MSGFEVAGIVLGAIPLLISALEHYKSGKSTLGTLVKWRGQLDTLLFRLKNQKLSFLFDILELLRSANVEDAVDGSDLTETECLLVLQSPKTGAYLQEYLGQHYDAFVEILGVTLLGSFLTACQADKDDLVALLAANPPGEKGFAFQERISFSIEKGRLVQLIEELNEDRLSLKTIIKGMKSQQQYTIKEPTRDSNKLATLLGQVQTQAQSLFTAVTRSCECSCPKRHRVLLQLHNRIPSSKVRKRTSAPKQPQMTFKLAVEIGDALYEAIVKPEPQVLTQRMRQERRAKDEPVVRCPFAPQLRHPNSTLQLTMYDNVLGLVDDTPEHGIIMTSPPERGIIMTSPLTLAEVLQRGNHNEAARMTFKEQTFLALDIACSIVQLRETRWLGSPFTSCILMVVTPEKKNRGLSTKPFIERTPESTLKSSKNPDPETVLRELAILLLELWHHRTLDIWCAKWGGDTDTTTPDGRLKAAINWVKATSDRIPPYYLDAVEQCISICCGRHRLWHDKEFLKIYCENVIIPLQESCRAWDVSEGWSEFP
ncbi:hypothetical protein PG985_009579 [Apiospora marii]|uniref:uncharacterized protein n=1 Tax=Apiospora marii TaxID=335849 RepID=UPI00312D526B